jgi:hypothetical protein
MQAPACVEECCWLVMNLSSQSKQHREAFLKGDIVDRMMQLLRDPNRSLEWAIAATSALKNICFYSGKWR